MFAVLVKSEDADPAAKHKLFAFKTDQKTVSNNQKYNIYTTLHHFLSISLDEQYNNRSYTPVM